MAADVRTLSKMQIVNANQHFHNFLNFTQARRKLAEFPHKSQPDLDATQGGQNVHKAHRENGAGVRQKVQLWFSFFKSPPLINGFVSE